MEKTTHETCSEIEDIKNEYNRLSQEHNLPGFEQLTQDFDIEKIFEKELSSYLLRDIRRIISEKLTAYLHLFENLLNPSSPPMFIFSILKNMQEADKEEIRKIYKQLSKLHLIAMKLDTIYNQEQEVEFIKKAFNEWQDLKTKTYKILQEFEQKSEENNNSSKKGYFG